MNSVKFTGIVKAVRSAYPNFKFIESEEGFKMWLTLLADVPDDIASLAFEKHILTEKYPPSVAGIREIVLELTNNSIDDWTEGFDLTRRAIKKFGSYQEYEALEWISSKNPIAGEVTRRLGFKELCLAENMDVIRGQYRRAYESYAADEKSMAVLPTSVKSRQKAIEDRYKMENLLKELGERMGSNV